MKWAAEHPGILIITITLGVGFLGAYPLPAVFVLTVLTVGVGVVRWLVWLDRRSNETISRRWDLQRRAEYEHWLVMHDDSRGVFGQYPPYV
jgi:hypothetical protein